MILMAAVGGALLGWVGATVAQARQRNPMMDYRNTDGTWRHGWQRKGPNG